MLRWIEQQFNKKSQSNSLSQDLLDRGEDKSSNLDLTDGDYEFLFNQLLEGVAHGWHQVRIVKFFQKLEERGEPELWTAWLKRFSQKLPASPNVIQRQLGARMIRLAELTQSHAKLQEIGQVSNEIGRKLFFGDIAEIIWEYDGLDIVSLPAPETDQLSEQALSSYEGVISDLGVAENKQKSTIEEDKTPIARSEELSLDREDNLAFIPEDDSEHTVIQNPIILDRTETEFPFIPEDDSEHTVIQNPVILDPTETEFPFVPEDDSEPTVIQNQTILDRTETEFPFIPEDDSEHTIIQNPIILDPTEGLSLDPEAEFPFVPEDDSEPTVIQNQTILEPTEGELSFVSDDTESPWEQPELIIEEAEPKFFPENSDQRSDSALPEENANEILSFESEASADFLPQELNLVETKSEKPDIYKNELQLNPPPTIQQVEIPESSSKNLEHAELLESWFELGLKQAGLGELEKAIASWNKVLELNPKLAEVWHNRGSALGRMGKYSESVISFDRALEIEPNHYQAWNDRAHALYLMEKWQEAIDSWNKTISIMPNNHQFWYNRGCALEKLNLIEQAIASHEKALEIQPDFEPAKSRYLSLLANT